MAERNERKKTKGSKGNEGEEWTDGSKQKGGGGEKDQKRTRLGGAAHYVHKRVKGQPKSTPKKKEGKSDSSKSYYGAPAPPPPNMESKESQQPQRSIWTPTPWEKTPPSDAKSTDSVQQMVSALGTVIPSTEETESDDIVLSTSDGATPPGPTSMKYDDDHNNADKVFRMAEGSASQKEANDKSSSDWDWPTTTWSTDATSRISTSNHSWTDTSKVSLSSSKFKALPDQFKQPTRSSSIAAGGNNRSTKIPQENDKLTIQHLEGKIEFLQKRLEAEEHLDKRTIFKGRIKEFQEKYEKLKAEEVTLQLAEASEDINLERQRVEKLEEQVNENQKELERIKKEKVAKVSELEERVRQYKKRLEEQELATDAARSEVEFLKKEEDRLKKENKELKKESKKTAIQSAQRIEEQEKEFMETERWEIKALTRDIEHSRAELKKQEDDFKSQLKEKEDEILRVSNQRNEQQAKSEACSSEIERLQRNYDADMEKLKVAIKKQHNIESTLRSELKELLNTITKIETDKRLELEELKKKHDEIGKKLDGQEKVVDKQKQDIETLQVTNKKLTEDGINKESEVQDTRDQLQKVEDKLAKNMEEKDEVIASLQQVVEIRSETVSQMKQALDQQMMRANKQLEAKQKQIDELVEKLQVEKAMSAIYKHDFETERNDQQKLHQSFIDLQAHCEYLKQKLTEEERFINAQGKYHELQKHEHYKLIAPMTDEVEKTKGELMKAKEQLSSLTKEKKRLEKRIKELEQGETERVIEIEEEMQALMTQVNAYSREVDKQKGLVAQSQEKHKTEVIQLQEKLKREMKSK
uniref:Uncharacterized protein n=1 Tax=Amphimedon queenslandica TaxID=400682 RepID=A0A1X7TU96_AMPQE